MKNLSKTLWMFFLVAGSVFAQQEKGIVGANNWLSYWSEFNPGTVLYSEPTQILAGNISEDIKLSKREVYLLLGDVFVTNNATLTIEPGTVILGDHKTKASLTIARGSTIIADGLETDPIVFTSNKSVKKAGDWGGLVVLGEATSNKFGNGSLSSLYVQGQSSSDKNAVYGGENDNSNSGILRYVRIEYAGKKINGSKGFSGLVLAGLGNKTILDNIMVSYSASNSFEILGGKIKLNNAVSFRSRADDFKFNFGTQVEMFNSLAVRSPYVSSRHGSRCLNVVSYDLKEGVDFNKEGTQVVAKNLTLINSSEDVVLDTKMGLIKEGIYIGYNASLDISKSVISGFNPAVILDSSIKVNQENLDKIKFTEMYFNNCSGNIYVEKNSNNEDLENWYGNGSFLNVYARSSNSETFIDLKNKRRPDFRLRINKIIASSGGK